MMICICVQEAAAEATEAEYDKYLDYVRSIEDNTSKHLKAQEVTSCTTGCGLVCLCGRRRKRRRM